MSTRTRTHRLGEPLALPLFEQDGNATDEPAWLREVYVAIPVEHARAMQAWCRSGPRPRWSEVVRALVAAFVGAEGDAPGAAERLEARLSRQLGGRESAAFASD